MAKLRYDDGVELSTDGELRVVWRKDGYYVVGEGLCCPVDSRREGEEMIAEMRGGVR